MYDGTYEEIDIGISDVRKLIDVIQKTYNYDLSNFALTAFKRRILRFLITSDISTMDEFITKIQNDKNLYHLFIRNLNVDITELFRDPAFWRLCRDKILPSLDSTHPIINVWIPNCSSGDEIFNMAIIAKEANVFNKVKILACGISNDILQYAKTGVYPISKLELSESNYKRFNEKGNFNDYLTIDKNTFIMDSGLLKNTTFEIFDITQPTQMKGFNIILYRNNFIYLNSNLQENLVSVFHRSLSLNGYLVIGHKETISWCKDAGKFSIENENEKVYKKTEV